ncbi:MAG: hypothetical protein QM689_04370 [Oscillospiraceae bacterium]
MALIKINGVELPQPSSYSVTWSDVDSNSTTRSEAAVLSRKRIRAGIYKITVGWTALTPAELQTVSNALYPATFPTDFFDPTTATYKKSATMYAGDKTAALSILLDDSARGASRWDYNVDITEC